MNPDAYLNRINYHGPTTPTVQTLHALQEAHLLTVPFENLSIFWDEPIIMDDDLLFEKVVNRKRGGFCYELNGLFAALLQALGFDVVMLSANVSRGEGEYTPDFAHMTLLVTLDEQWLVEVGFGATFRLPLRLDETGKQEQPGASYLLQPKGRFYTLLEQKIGGEWKPQYRFTLTQYQYQDFEEMCHYQQYHPDSHFRQGRVCSRITADGRITLSDKEGLTFIRTWLDGRREETTLPNEPAFHAALKQHFNITRNP